MGCLQLLDYLSDSRSNSSWNDKLLILRMLKVQHCKSDTWVMCCPHFHWMCFFIIFEARKLTRQGFQASFRQFICLHSKWMSWKHVERWQRCLAANKPVLKTFRNRSALPKVIEGLSNKWPMDGMSFWHMLAFQLVRTLWIRCISSTFIHIWHIFISPTIIIANTSQIKSCSNLSPKKRLRPSDRQVGDGASSGSRSRSQSRMGQLLIPDWLPAVTNPLLSHSERGVWRIISRVSSLRDVYIYTYICMFVLVMMLIRTLSPRPFSCIFYVPACSSGSSVCGPKPKSGWLLSNVIFWLLERFNIPNVFWQVWRQLPVRVQRCFSGEAEKLIAEPSRWGSWAHGLLLHEAVARSWLGARRHQQL